MYIDKLRKQISNETSCVSYLKNLYGPMVDYNPTASAQPRPVVSPVGTGYMSVPNVNGSLPRTRPYTAPH